MFRNFSLYLTASSFIAGTIAMPLNAYQQCKATQLGINLNDIAFVARIEKLVERVKKYKDKMEQRKLIEVLFEIKTEVEGYTGKKCDIDTQLDQIEREATQRGAQFKRGEMKQIRTMLRKSEKKHNHKALYLAECNMYDIPFDQLECDYLYKAASKHDKKEDKEEVELPLRVTIGVTASLCGYFLSFIPHPYAQMASKTLIWAGIEMTVEGTINRIEENNQKQKDKDKK